MLESLKLVCCQLPDVKKGVDSLVDGVPKSFGILTSMVEARDEASSEGFETAAMNMDKFGLGDSAPEFDIPGSLLLIQKALKTPSSSSLPPPQPSKPHEGACTYKQVQGQSNTLICTMGCTSPVSTIPNQSPPAVQNFAVPPPRFVPYDTNQVLGDGRFLQQVYDTTPVKTIPLQEGASDKVKVGLSRQLKQKKKFQNYKARKQQQHEGDQYVYIGGQAYQPMQHQNQVQQGQSSGHQQHAAGSFLLHPGNATNAGVGLLPQPSPSPTGGAGGSQQYRQVQYQGSQYSH